MRIKDCNWHMLEEYLQKDDRVVLPLGSTEQHAYLSLCTDAILAEEVSAAAAAPLGIPVYPALPFGLAPYFMDFPGSVSLRVTTYCNVVEDLLESLAAHGFKRIFIVNGHGGNQPAFSAAQEWACKKSSGVQVKFHNWWNAPETWEKVTAVDPSASHGSWMENFVFTRLARVKMPQTVKDRVSLEAVRQLDPKGVRRYVGDGNYGGAYAVDDSIMDDIWRVAVEETRELLKNGWF